ncbi:uncharacterized protein LOC132885941 [Neoarius graeffei]|uniref:uncharacterized protein LOC132885941 n=1 Tax=Neoarius graeffei TaxID=443677 RepID=UPI00298CA549|nr:uncharacterized protein LOC132885941 [Neoarius graeffei]
MKTYSDTRRHARPHPFQPGDMVLCSQPRHNKLTPTYNPKPYKVTTVKGTMVTAERSGHSVTRNSSFFKKLSPTLHDTAAEEEDDVTPDVTTGTAPVLASLLHMCSLERMLLSDATHREEETLSGYTAENPKATVRVNPQSSVYTGDTITLSCELQQGAGWRFHWYKYNQDSQYMNTGATDTNTLNVTVDTAGETGYRCGAHRRNAWANTDYNYYYTYYSDFVRITVRVRPKPVASVNPDKQVFSGDAVTLRCDIQDESVSSWQYSWYKVPSHSGVSSEQVYTISGVKATHTGNYTCRGAERGGSRSSHFSDAVTLTVSERPRPVLSVSPQSWLTEGDSVTLSCEVTGSSTDWTFSWYTTVPYRSGLTQITNSRGYNMSVELLSDSSRGSGGKYTLSPAALNHTGVYMCRGERGEPASHTQYSNPQPLWITGESPPVSLIINPNRTQHFTSDSLSLSCNSTDQSRSTGWTVRRYTHSEGVLDCSPCKISSLSTSYTGVYWCHSESGENRNPVNITVQDGAVILESPVHPVAEGHPLTLHCLYRNPKPSNLRGDFYKDGSVLQPQTTGEMIIHKVSKSHEGFYHCKHPERGESLKSWVSVRLPGFRSSVGTVGVAVGLGFFFIALLILMILLWSYKRKKEKQQKTNQTSDQNQRRSGAEETQAGYTPLQAGTEHIYDTVAQADTSGTGEAATESSKATYAKVMKKKKANRNNGADAEQGAGDGDVTYAEIELKPTKKSKKVKEKASLGDDTVYSELQQNMKKASASPYEKRTKGAERGGLCSSHFSDAVTLTVSEKPKATVRVNPQSSVYTGDTITLSCELQQGAGWQFLWDKYNQYWQFVNTGATNTNTLRVTVDTAGETGYRCIARRRNTNYYYYYTDYSNEVRITVRVRPKPVASVNPDKQVFSGDAVTLRCDIQDESVSSWQYSWYKVPSHSRVSSEQVYTISGVKVAHTGNYTCRGAERGGSRSSHFSDAVTLEDVERPLPVLSASPQSWLTEGDSVTLSCEVTGSSTDWTFSWYTTVPYRSGLTQITNSRGYNMSVELLSDSSRGSGGKYTLSPAALKHTGVYMCRGERGEPAFHTPYSNPQPLWVTGESPPVSLIINPNRTQHFTSDSLSLSCNSTDQSRSTGWTVRRYTHSEGVLDCSPCKISSLSTSYTGVYWCHSESGENRNPVNITVQDGAVILESPVHPVTEGHPLTLRCLYRNPKPSNLRADFYKDESVLQTQTTGEMIIHNVSKSDEGFYHCKHPERGESLKSWVSVRLLVSLIPVAHVQGRVKAVVSIQPDAHVFIGEDVTLRCDTQGGGDTQWPYGLYKDGIYITSKELNIRSVGDSVGGSYTCRGQDSEISDAVTLTVSGESPPVSLIINPNRTQHFTSDSLSLSCNSTDQSRSTGWTVRRYTHSEGVLDCSPCKISSLSTSYTGVYWCHSESGENRNPVNITVQDGAVILESPVHPVTEGHPLTLHCLYRNPKPSNLRADFYKDGSVLQTQTTGEMIIHNVSKSHEGFYHCKHPERGDSLKSWVSVRRERPSSVPGFRSSGGTVGVAVGLGFLFIALLILMILLWSYKRKKEKQQKTNQTSDQNQRRSRAEDSQAGYTPLQAGNEHIYDTVTQADTSGTGTVVLESFEATYTKVTKKKKANRNNGADAEQGAGVGDVTYAEIELKQTKKLKKVKEKASLGDDTVYSELQQNMKCNLTTRNHRKC